jgi:hypothetical protein
MSNNETEERDHAYFIQLPIEEAAEVSDELEETVWTIAEEEGVEQTLRDANFDLRVGKTFIDPNTLITVIVHFAATGAVSGAASKITSIAIDQAWKAWTTKVLPRLKEKLGQTVLVDKDEQKEDK